MSERETVRYCGRDFSDDDLTLIRRLATTLPTRRAIADALCDELSWHRPDGRRKDMSARVALLRMETDGLLCLPAPKNGNGRILRHEPPGGQLDLFVSKAPERLSSVEFVVPDDQAKRARRWRLVACRPLGAQAAFDYRDPELPRRPHDAAPAGVDVHLDTFGRHYLDLALGLLAPRWGIILMAGITHRPELPAGALYTRDAQILGFVIRNARTTELRAAAHRVNQLVADGSLMPRNVEEPPLNAAVEAHRRLETGQASGVRLILRP